MLSTGHPVTPSEMDVIRRKFRIEAVDQRQFLDDTSVRRRALHHEMGWHELPDHEDEQLWRLALKKLDLETSRPDDGTGRSGPAVSLTWSIPDPICDWSRDFIRFRIRKNRGNFNRCVLGSLRENVVAGERIFCLDYNHPGYSIDPNDENVEFYAEWWPIHMVPDDSWVLFTVADVSMGIYINPIERSLCAFGRGLPKSLKNALAPHNLEIVRRSAE
jgi:hypothetical protein